MKIIKNKTHYTLIKGMGDVVIGEIIHYEDLGCRFISIKDKFPNYDIKDLTFILNKMKEIENE